MAYSYTEYTGDGTTQTFTIPFAYEAESEVAVFVAGTQLASSDFSFLSTSTISINTAPANNANVRVERNTDLTNRAVDFVDGAVLSEADLDTAMIQVFHGAQEAIDTANDAVSLDADGTFDAQNRRIKNVADPSAAQDAATKNYIENVWLTPSDKTQLNNLNLTNLNTVATDISNVNTTATNITNVNTVASDITDVNTVAGDSADIQTLAAISTDITTAAGISSDITTVAAKAAAVQKVADDLNEQISEVETVANDLNEITSEIETVANSITNVDTVGTNIGNVNTVAGISSNVTSVAGNASNINAAVSNAANINAAVSNANNITAVANNETNINAVNANSTNINTVAGNNTNVTTVAGISTNVSTVAGISSDVTAVANISQDIQDVQDKLTELQTVSNDLNEATSEIETVAASIANVDSVGTNINNVNTVAANLTNVNNFADQYSVGNTQPSSPTDGDLWFDTSANVMKVYNGSGFINAGSAVNGINNSVEYTATAGQTTFNATYDSGFVEVYMNGIRLDDADFTATNGSTVVLNSGAAAGDTVYIQAFGTFELLNTGINDLTDVNTTGVADGQALLYNSTTSKFEAADVDALPTQTGNSGKYLTTDGTNSSWADVDALPSQTGNSGKYLTTDGSTTSWANTGAAAGVFWENDQTLAADYTITTGKNAGTFGAITINSGVTVTVPTGSTWTIV